MIEVGKYYIITNTTAPGFKIISECTSDSSDMYGHGFSNVAILSTDLSFNGDIWNAHKLHTSFKVPTLGGSTYAKQWRFKEVDISKHPEYFL